MSSYNPEDLARFAKALGAMGGKSRSPKKVAASRINAAKAAASLKGKPSHRRKGGAQPVESPGD